MELQLDAHQELFLETTRRFLEAQSPLTAVRKLAEDAQGFNREYWSEGARLGWTAMLVPDSLGGGSVSGSGLLDLVLVAEEFGRLVSPGPLAVTNVVAAALARSGTEEQQASSLPELMAGDRLATWAFAEGPSCWDPDCFMTTAIRTSDGWELEGKKAFVQDATVADEFLVTVRTDHGLTQFLLPRGLQGLSVEARQSLDLTRRYGEVTLSGCRAPDSMVVGASGGAARDVEFQLQVARSIQNAETVGAINRVFEFTLQYAKDRVAFGRPIGSYQALKHRLADMKMWLEACNATAAASACAVQQQQTDASRLVRIASSYIADRAPAIIQDCVQLHGGIGVTWEHDLHLYLRRVTQNSTLYGSARDHRAILATALEV